MKPLIHTFKAFLHFDEKHLNRPWLFFTNGKTRHVKNWSEYGDKNKILRVDEGDKAHSRIKHEKHIAYAQNHRGARKPLI